MLSLAALAALAAVACGGGGAETTEPAPAASSEGTPAAAPQQPVASPEELQARLQQLEQQALANPNNLDLQRRYARGVFALRDPKASVPLFEQVAAADPSPASWLDLALVYTSQARYDESMALYDRILAQRPEDAIAHHNRANLQARRGDYTTAIAGYRRALAIRPNYLLAQSHLGDAYERNEQFKEAYRAYEQVLTLTPESAEELSALDNALFKLASLDIRMGAFQRAAQFLQELLRANPEHAQAHYAYARLLIQAGQTEQAQPHLEAHMRLMEAADRGGVAAMGE